jgi:hypothetical protein
MQIRAMVAAAKKTAPILLNRDFEKLKSPKVEKTNAKTPAATKPTLKIGAVNPFATPKSLRALFVQLKGA